MTEKKRRVGRPQEIPKGASIWSVRVTAQEKKALSELLAKMRESPGASAARRGRK